MLNEGAPAVHELELMQPWRRLVIVPGYCHLRADATDYNDPESWFLNKYQKANPANEISYIIGMIRDALLELKWSGQTIVCFSGGYTSPEAGPNSSEAQSYLNVAKMMSEQESSLFGNLDMGRIILDTSSYDSNNNLRGGITAFYQNFGYVPGKVVFYVYELKKRRMEMVAAALGIGEDRFTAKVVPGPGFSVGDRERENKILEDMREDLLFERDSSEHARLSRRRNWRNAPINLMPVDEIRRLYAELAESHPFFVSEVND
jgi:hypothetical protein